MMTVSDELLASEPDINFVTSADKSFIQWFDAILGLLSASTLLLVGHLVKFQSNVSWQGLLLTSLASVSLFSYVLLASLSGNSIAEKMLHHYRVSWNILHTDDMLESKFYKNFFFRLKFGTI